MTKSAPVPLHLSAKLSKAKALPNPAAIQTPGWGHALVTLSLRLMLLGLSGSIMAAVGIAAAQIYPAQTQELPLVELWTQRAKSMLDRGLSRVGISPQAEVKSQSEIQSAVPNLTPVASPEVSSAPGSTGLPDAERQNLQAELQALTSQSSQPLAARVKPLQTRIQTIQSRLSAFTADSSSASVHAVTTPIVNPATDSISTLPVASKSLLVTLPSDALFEVGQVTLRPGSEAILRSIVSDLQSFPDASIQISAYTDSQSSPELAREHSLEQAKAVRQYLSQPLGSAVHWVAIGQGQNQPLVPEDSPESRQRNRRIEIAIQPE